MAEEQKDVGLDLSWKHTKNRRLVKIRFGDAHVTLSHPQTEQGAMDITVLVQVLPAALEQMRAAIEEKDAIDHGIEH
jgi:hypothetical protein